MAKDVASKREREKELVWSLRRMCGTGPLCKTAKR